LLQQYAHLSVAQSNVLLVAGNHDVDRGEVTQDQTDWLERQSDVATVTKLIDHAGKQWERYMERLGAYKAFLQQRGYKHLLGDPDRLIYAQTREVCGIKIGIAGFNSAWSCCRDGEKGRLWLGGDWQVEELTSQLNEADFSIALIHHPLNWFVEQGGDWVQRIIARKTDHLGMWPLRHLTWLERLVAVPKPSSVERRPDSVVLSENYVYAAHTQPEWATAFLSDPKGKQRELISIRIDKCNPSGLLAGIV
jgi:hypothetical protein